MNSFEQFALWSGAQPADNQIPPGYPWASGFYINNNTRTNSTTQHTFQNRLHVQGERVRIKVLKNGVADQASTRMRLNIYSAPGSADDRTDFVEFRYADFSPADMEIGAYSTFEFTIPNGDAYILLSIYYHFEILEVTAI